MLISLYFGVYVRKLGDNFSSGIIVIYDFITKYGT